MPTPLTPALFQTFDPQADFSVVEHRLPHWSQPGTLCFITWRTDDSLPQSILHSWRSERDAWLRERKIDTTTPDWKALIRRLPPQEQRDYHERFSSRWQAFLDDGHGACILRQPDLSAIVADSLRHFDGERYLLSDFVVMPNHVHVLACFADAEQMAKQCAGWKHFTATRINQALRREGRFWQAESFDHLVRNEKQFEYLRGYIADNPRRASLRIGEFNHYRRDGLLPTASAALAERVPHFDFGSIS